MDLIQCSKALIWKDPWYGHIALGLQKEFSTKVPTACAQINGMNIDLYFNEEYFNKLDDKQKVGLMQHELGHVCMFHLNNWDDFPDKEIYNIATDMCINQYIEPDYLPPNGIRLNSFPELNLPPFKDSKFYYDELSKANKSGTSPKLDKLISFMKSGGVTVAGHPLWGVGENGEPVPDGIKELVRAQIEHQIKQVYEENFNKNPGNIPGYLRELVLALYMKTPPVFDWKTVVRQFKSFCDKQVIKLTRNKPNKRFPDFDAVTLRQRRKMLVGIDVSGSISESTLVEFYTQIGHMSKHGVEIDIAEWDFGLTRPIYRFNTRNPNSNMKGFKGGGGTSAVEVMSILNKSRDHNALIMLTDGYISGEWKKLSKPVLWIITANGTKEFNYVGKKIISPTLK